MENNVVNNSCLMLACALYTPIMLSSVFDEEDLKDNGIEIESHITLLYSQGKIINKDNIIDDIRVILGEDSYNEFMNFLKNGDSLEKNIFSMFELGKFENDSDFIVLKLKRDHYLFKILNLINTGLRNKYEVKSDFNSYTPHITLAKLNSGMADKYLSSKKLKLILNESKISFEDLIISYGPSNVIEDKEKYNLTTFHAIDRYFRENELKKEILYSTNI